MAEAHATTVKDLQQLSNNVGKRWWQDAGLRRLNSYILVIWLSQIVGGYDIALMGSLVALPRFLSDMGNPNPAQIGTLQAIMHMGSIAGGIPGAIIADRWGRKPAMIAGCVVEIIGVVISTCHNQTTFLIGRFIIGMGVNLALTVGPAWTSELAHPRQRGVISSCYNVLWYVGAIFAAWISFGTGHMTSTWSWRIPSLVQGIPPVLIIAFSYWVPESPRFLLGNDRIEEGRALLAHLHANGNEADELVEFEVMEISTTLKMEAEANKASWDVLWSSRANLRRFLIALSLPLIVLWNGQGVITYYYAAVLKQVGITTVAQQTGINGGLQIFNMLCSIFGVWAAERFGRRPMWLASFMCMVLANVIMTTLSGLYASQGEEGLGYGVVVTLFLYNAAFNIACNPLIYCYMVEILPFYMRAKATAVAVSWSSALIVFNSYVNSIALDAIGWKYYLVYLGLLFVFLAIIYFFYPETKGMVLEGVAVQFEGERAAVVKAGITPETVVELRPEDPAEKDAAGVQIKSV